MTDVTFVRTRTEYPPYADFYRLAELSGYPICWVDEIDPGDPTKVYVISPINGEWMQGWPRARARIIFEQLEWHTDHKPVELPPGVSEAWTGDAWHARLINARHVPIGGHIGLNLDPDDCPEKEYDVVFMAYTDIHRRSMIKNALEARGLKLAPNGWGQERHDILARSRVMVHVHQHENIPTIAPLRWCIAAAYGLPIISESVNDRRPFGEYDFMTCDYDRLADFITAQLKEQHDDLSRYGDYLRNTLCKVLTFRESVERAL
jgi:hypothetical protein